VLVRPTRTGSPTAVGSPPRLNERDAVVTAIDPLSAIAHSSASRRPWASARRRDDGDGDGRLDRDGDARRRDGGDGDGRLDRDGDGCRPPPRLNERDAVVARCCRRRRRCRRVNIDVAQGLGDMVTAQQLDPLDRQLCVKGG
jgi:hypothetical protein